MERDWEILLWFQWKNIAVLNNVVQQVCILVSQHWEAVCVRSKWNGRTKQRLKEQIEAGLIGGEEVLCLGDLVEEIVGNGRPVDVAEKKHKVLLSLLDIVAQPRDDEEEFHLWLHHTHPAA